MELRELIRRFRVESNDKVAPYFIEDEDVIAWLNDAVNEACIRGRLLHESNVSISVQDTKSIYSLSKSIYEITRICFIRNGSELSNFIKLVSTGELDRIYCNDWANKKGQPEYAVQTDTKIRLVPQPNINGILQIEGYRVPLSLMSSDTDEPEINSIHHVYLIQWVLHKAFSVVDAEFFDPNRAAIAEQAFTDYFGIRPDSDLRRMTREDVLHHVKPFMP
ncbi:phage adaptor protein [Acinetobacter ursingii]|uniref:Uncharacterized protein n=1 Tax=Acinetobacter ursingii TaxID=108980 RepID=A0AA46NDJ8_9GAMM|nr:DUF6682 family protein [Acinetobacter ursingii]UYF70492.1 hypothetical protein LSO60_09305 [Acinetobacter ursingii]